MGKQLASASQGRLTRGRLPSASLTCRPPMHMHAIAERSYLAKARFVRDIPAETRRHGAPVAVAKLRMRSRVHSQPAPSRSCDVEANPLSRCPCNVVENTNRSRIQSREIQIARATAQVEIARCRNPTGTHAVTGFRCSSLSDIPLRFVYPSASLSAMRGDDAVSWLSVARSSGRCPFVPV